MPSPPKPWERAAGAGGMNGVPDSSLAADSSSTTSSSSSPEIPSRSSTAPTLPARPATSTATALSAASTGPYSRFTASPYNSSPYSSPYSSMGGMGMGGMGMGMGGYGSSIYGGGGGAYSSYGTGGGYGSSYGSAYGSSAYGRPGFGGLGGYGYGNNQYGVGTPPNMMDPNNLPLTARVEQSTQQAFFMLDQIVQAFAGFSHMLDSTFHATHSSFMAMVGVAEQFGHLRNYLGQVLSVMSLVRFLKDTANWMMGRHSKSGNNLDADSFQSFVNGSGGGSGGGGGSKPRTSSRPIWVFFAFVIGFPWLVTKLITRIQKKRLEQSGDAAFNNNGSPLANNFLTQQQTSTAANSPTNSATNSVITSTSQIKELEFCRALYDFTAESGLELSLKRGDIVAILSKYTDGAGGDSRTVTSSDQVSLWWRGRMQNGTMGLFPANYVQVIEKKVNNNSSSSSSSAAAAAAATSSGVEISKAKDVIGSFPTPPASSSTVSSSTTS